MSGNPVMGDGVFGRWVLPVLLGGMGLADLIGGEQTWRRVLGGVVAFCFAMHLGYEIRAELRRRRRAGSPAPIVVDMALADIEIDIGLDVRELRVVAGGRTFAAAVGEPGFEAFQRLIGDLPRAGTVDLRERFTEALGRDPFVEVDTRPWWRRLAGRAAVSGTGGRSGGR